MPLSGDSVSLFSHLAICRASYIKCIYALHRSRTDISELPVIEHKTLMIREACWTSSLPIAWAVLIEHFTDAHYRLKRQLPATSPEILFHTSIFFLYSSCIQGLSATSCALLPFAIRRIRSLPHSSQPLIVWSLAVLASGNLNLNLNNLHVTEQSGESLRLRVIYDRGHRLWLIVDCKSYKTTRSAFTF